MQSMLRHGMVWRTQQSCVMFATLYSSLRGGGINLPPHRSNPLIEWREACWMGLEACGARERRHACPVLLHTSVPDRRRSHVAPPVAAPGGTPSSRQDADRWDLTDAGAQERTLKLQRVTSERDKLQHDMDACDKSRSRGRAYALTPRQPTPQTTTRRPARATASRADSSTPCSRTCSACNR